MPVKDICFVLGLKKSTVYRTLHNFCLYGAIYKRKPGNRHRILTSRDLKALCNFLHGSHTLYLDEMQDMLSMWQGKSVSISTISCALNQMNYS